MLDKGWKYHTCFSQHGEDERIWHEIYITVSLPQKLHSTVFQSSGLSLNRNPFKKYNIYCSKKLKEHLKKNQIMNIYTNMDSVICYGWWRCHVVWRNWKLSAYTQGRFIAGPKIDLGQVSMGGINPSIVHDLFAHPCHVKQGITVHQGEQNTHCTSSGSDKVFKDPNY